jgi:hypothetical protein
MGDDEYGEPYGCDSDGDVIRDSDGNDRPVLRPIDRRVPFAVQVICNRQEEIRRETRLQLVLDRGSVYIDVEPDPLRVLRASFDGYGCYRFQMPVPIDEAWYPRIFADVAAGSYTDVVDNAREELLLHLREQFTAQNIDDDDWLEAFQDFGLVA